MAQQETVKKWHSCGLFGVPVAMATYIYVWLWQHLHAAHITPSALLLLHDSVKTSAYVEEYSTVFRYSCMH